MKSDNGKPSANEVLTLPEPAESPTEEYLVRELCYDRCGQHEEFRFSPAASTAMLNELAQEGWRVMPGSIFAVASTELRVGTNGVRSRVYATFIRPLGNGAGGA